MLPLTEHRAARLEALQAEDGWLNLTDRVELNPGPQSVGQAPDNQIQLSTGPAHLGLIDPTTETVTPPDAAPIPFLPTTSGFPQLRIETLLLELHTADGTPALRVRDLTLPREAILHYFPTNPSLIIRARWQTLPTPIQQSINQKGGAPTTVSLTHTAHFTYQNHAITLLATHWKDGKPMFVIRDQTSGVETYPASRFLIGEDASDTEITLDFNRAFTPPCGFTDFAICPLPPRENILPFRVEAGERLTP
ncbi:MAG: hypothetical protein JWS10_4069 [Cypionkella sp.]|uniref:DUF1684 domain-containing protein n=1 Tax=Cypionkella sp. TaxID=2811411 RepID=UPI0026164C32|nr:DUF1684 domain-containing protein [Cypionkella sp.]MDB5661454.1 hypothetical protein [Cypionkella sp.]